MKTPIRALRSDDTVMVHATGSRYYGRGGHVVSQDEPTGYRVALFGERRGTSPLHFEASELEADVYDAAESADQAEELEAEGRANYERGARSTVNVFQQHALIAGISSQGEAASHGHSAHLTSPAPAVPIEVDR